ncbi:MAG: thiolase family protein [Bdellovibrionota bacterium]
MEKKFLNAFVVDARRTAIGRSHPEKGALRNVRADALIAMLIKEATTKAATTKAATTKAVSPDAIDDVFIGCVGQHLEQGKNIARLSSLLAGLPDRVPGVTINRLCASSLQALNFAAMTLDRGDADIILAGGVEHMHHVPMAAALDYNQELLGRYEFPFNNMGLTAEKVAEVYGISRREQDEFAFRSHKKALEAQSKGHFAREIIPVTTPDGVFSKDQLPRADTNIETLLALKSSFKENGTVTAGNSSPLSDGASLTTLLSADGLRRTGAKARAQILDYAVVGIDPCLMGMGPVPAIQKLLGRSGFKVNDIDVFELNEAFASQAIACMRELEISEDRVNLFGGAIALGHPLGCTGTRLITTLINVLESTDKEFGVTAMCVGHGQGVATLVRRMG